MKSYEGVDVSEVSLISVEVDVKMVKFVPVGETGVSGVSLYLLGKFLAVGRRSCLVLIL